MITRIDDHLVDGADDLVATVRTYRPGDKVKVTFVRGGDERTVTLELGSDAE
ncbi:PDZ domain-containing protein [Nocardioides daphniae]|uniref:PDZ domain-containing protein n=1 Tax=Nocardioides daphniae TaxID=402297 RepID=UPI001EE79CCC|nr:PDZ domain-containing protein [Nocardioides daphniae]